VGHHPFSPSSLERIELCPGSYALSQGMEERQETDIAEEGNLLHLSVPESQSIDTLAEDQKELVESCRTYVRQLKEWYPEVTGWAYETPLKLVKDFEILSAGTPDLVGEAPGYIVVADWKFGFKETTPADKNIQVRTYGTMKMSERRIPRAFLHIHHPRLNVSTDARMEMDGYTETIERVKAIRAAALDTDVMRLNPSEKACEYCPAKAMCPALKARGLSLAKVHSSQLIDPEVMGGLLTKAKMVKKWAESVEYHAKMMALRNGGLPGYKLRAMKGRREITNAQAAFDLLSAYFTPQEYMAHCEVGVGALETAFIAKVRAEEPKTSVAAAKSLFETTLLSVIARGQESQTLVAQ
jgi:hypothetical protein